MCVMKLKNYWNINNDNLVNDRTGRILSEGLALYWHSIDDALQYNVAKREQFLAKGKTKIAYRDDKVTFTPREGEIEDFF